jgi:hypothetical protein
MARDIHPLEPDALPELSRFLTAGFHAPPDAEFASVDVLRWKYFDPRGCGDEARSFVARDAGQIIGHIGICPTAFCARSGTSTHIVSALHIIDWLGSREHPGVGSSLIRKVHALADTQFGVGTTEAAKKVIRVIGYENRATVPIFQRVFRPAYRLHSPGLNPAVKVAQATRDLARSVMKPARQAAIRLEASCVDAFGSEVESLFENVEGPIVLTRRDAALLNYYLKYPRGTISGWRLSEDGRTRGCALLSIVSRGKQRIGKIVDCILESRAAELWHAAMMVLAQELQARGADVAQACGSVPWVADALTASGFIKLHDVALTLRDRQQLVPRDMPLFLTFLEGDYAYT